MTAAALVVLVLVVARRDGGDAATEAIRVAMIDALGGRAQVVVHGVEKLPADQEAIAEERSTGALAIAEVAWGDEGPAQATIHVHIAGSTAWLDRRIGFAASDAPGERARTVGFAIASVVPEAATAAEPPAPEPPAPTAPPPQAPVPAAPNGEPAARGRLEPAAVAPPSKPVQPREPLGALDLSVVGAWGGAAGGGGTELGFERRWRSISARLAFEWRTGDVTAAQIRTLVLSALPGIAWRPVEPSEQSPFGVGLRASYVVLREQLTRPVDGATPPAQWQSGAQALVEGSWMFAPEGLLVVAAGGEAAFGTFDVVVGGRTVASIEPLRALAQGGIRVRF